MEDKRGALNLKLKGKVGGDLYSNISRLISLQSYPHQVYHAIQKFSMIEDELNSFHNTGKGVGLN